MNIYSRVIFPAKCWSMHLRWIWLDYKSLRHLPQMLAALKYRIRRERDRQQTKADRDAHRQKVFAQMEREADHAESYNTSPRALAVGELFVAPDGMAWKVVGSEQGDDGTLAKHIQRWRS